MNAAGGHIYVNYRRRFGNHLGNLRLTNIVLFPNSNTLLWGLWPRLALVRSGAASTGSGQGSGGYRVTEGSGADEIAFRKILV